MTQEDFDSFIYDGSFGRGISGRSKWRPSKGQWGIFGKSGGRREFESKRSGSRASLREQAGLIYNPKLKTDEQGIALGLSSTNVGDYMGKLGEMSAAQETFDIQDAMYNPETGTEIMAAQDLLSTTKADINRSLMNAIEIANQSKLSDARTLESERVSSGMFYSGGREAMADEMTEASDMSIMQRQEDASLGIEAAEGQYESTKEDIERTYKLDVLQPFEKAESEFAFLTGESGLKQQYLSFLDELDLQFFTPRESHRREFEERYNGGDVGTFDTSLEARKSEAKTIDFAKLVEKA